MRLVVMDIDLFEIPGIMRRRWIYPVAAAFGCGVLALAIVMQQTPLYHASVELIIDPASLRSPTAGDNAIPNTAQEQLSTDSQIYVMQSSEVLTAVVEKLDLSKDSFLAPATAGGTLSRLTGGGRSLNDEERKQAAIGSLREDISVLRASQSLVFTISMKHPSAQKAADIANAVAETYLGLVGESRSGSALRASMTLQSQAEELRQRLQKAQNEVEAFKAEHNLFSTPTKGLVADQEIEALSQQIGAASARVESQKTIYEQASRLSTADVASGAIPEAMQSTALVSLRTRYAQLLDSEAQLAANLGSSHPQLKAARSQTASMRKSIEGELARLRESLRSTYQRAQADRDSLQIRYDALTKTTGESGDARTRLAQLQSDADALKELYQSYISKAEDLGGKQAVDTGASRIISAATPPSKATGASKGLTLVAGVIFGIMLGTGLAVLHELLARMMPKKEVRKVQDKSGIPVVARVAAARSNGFFSRFKRDRKANREGLSRVASIIGDAFADHPSKNPKILFVPAENLVPGLLALDELAEELAEDSVIVNYTTGRAVPMAQPVLLRQGPRVVVSREPAPAPGWSGGTVEFETVGYYPVSLLSRNASNKEFSLADASLPAVQAELAELMRDADAIFAMTAVSTPKSDTQALGRALAPFRDRLLGMIVIED